MPVIPITRFAEQAKRGARPVEVPDGRCV